MKARMLAVLLVAGAAAVPVHSAEAGLRDALSNKVGQAVFLGKVAKARVKSTLQRAVKKAWDLGPL